jgi:hypothetical protein
MTYEAVVIPVDETQPARVVTYQSQRDLLPLLRREIGCDLVDSTPQLPSKFGPFRLWVDDIGLFRTPIEHNDRAIGLCRVAGYDVPDLAGTAVVTGGHTARGDTATIPPQLRNLLLEALAPPPAPTDTAGRRAQPSPSPTLGNPTPRALPAPGDDLSPSRGPDQQARSQNQHSNNRHTTNPHSPTESSTTLPGSTLPGSAGNTHRAPHRPTGPTSSPRNNEGPSRA